MGTVIGAEEMQRRFSALRETVAVAGTRKAIAMGGRVIRDAMRERAPVGPVPSPKGTALDSGELKADIRSRIHKDGLGGMAALIGPSEETGYVARFVEYGHRQVRGGYSRMLAAGNTRGDGKEIGEVPPHPFLRPAFEASASDAREAFSAELKKQIREVLG